MFYFSWGNYNHDGGEVLIARQTQKNNFSNVNRGVVTSVTKQMTVNGILHGSGPADLTAKLEQMQSNYADQGRDLSLNMVGGGQTTFAWRSRDTINGIQVVSFDFEKNDKVEYCTYKSYSITFQGEFPESSNNLLDWQETMSIRGTGKKIWVYPPVLDERPEKQTTRKFSTVTVDQQGTALGLKFPPKFPLPYFPDDEHEEQREVGGTTPRRGGADHSISWRYVMELLTVPDLTPGKGLNDA